ncbi:MAG: dUTP diphosphatase [Nanoarchaeota archaeon]|nr:dUTP diphosphatase [Nanoarchaeota archaeon]MBU1631938.1 dUTP diphosphatase [Nanoarchaeota archaeon]MBU1875674.1 dUTP diphosphatase [Nanoarchaeota archaeon]
MLKIKKLTVDSILPKYAGPNEAGMDFYSNEEVNVEPNERKIISTGIAMSIPHNYVGLIWDRSGLAAKHGIKTMGGVIDSTYRGEIKIIVHNLSKQPFTVEKGMRIAQMLIQPVEQKEIIEVEDLDETERGESGFGSTGLE